MVLERGVLHTQTKKCPKLNFSGKIFEIKVIDLHKHTVISIQSLKKIVKVK